MLLWGLCLGEHFFQSQRSKELLQPAETYVLFLQDGVFLNQTVILITKPVILLLQFVSFARYSDQIITGFGKLVEQAFDKRFQLL